MRNLTPKIHRSRGLTMLEVIVVMIIIGILAGASLVSLRPILTKESLDKAAQTMMEDLVQARSATVTELVNRRLSLESSSSYCIEIYDEATTSWLPCAALDITQLPPGNEFRYDDYPLLAKGLEFEPNGLPNFNGTPSGNFSNDPYITIKNEVAGKSKGIYISAAGAMKLGKGETDVIP